MKLLFAVIWDMLAKSGWYPRFALLVLLFLVFRAVAPVAGWAIDEDGARTALVGQGYTKISVGGYAWFACSKGDFYQTKFTAKGLSGHRVNGAVCSGLFWKGHTIRTN